MPRKPVRSSRSRKPATARKPARRALKPRKVEPIPEGYAGLIPGTQVVHAADAIALYERLFGARERVRFEMDDGRVAHAELEFGPSVLMIGEAHGPPVQAQLSLYVKDCDAVFAAAVAAGSEVRQPPTDQFYGDRTARIVDPFGNEWVLATHVEEVSEKEMHRRAKALEARSRPG